MFDKHLYVIIQLLIFAALFAVAAASSYKAAEYAPKYEAKYEEVTYVSSDHTRKFTYPVGLNMS